MEFSIKVGRLFPILKNWVADGWKVYFNTQDKRVEIDEMQQTHIYSYALFSEDGHDDWSHVLIVNGWDEVVLSKQLHSTP